LIRNGVAARYRFCILDNKDRDFNMKFFQVNPKSFGTALDNSRSIYICGSYIDVLVPYVLMDLGGNYLIMDVAFAAGLMIAGLNANIEGSRSIHWKTGTALGVAMIHLSMFVYASNHSHSNNLIQYYGRPRILLAITWYNAFFKVPHLFFYSRSQRNRKGESKK
jgi:hypothetical protein